MARRDRERGRAIIGWFKNTMVDPDIIMDHLGVTKDKQSRADLRKVAKDIRDEIWENHFGKEKYDAMRNNYRG